MSEKYWVERGRTYLENFNKKTVIQKLRYWIQEQVIIGALNLSWRKFEVKNILDAGCGFGRITRILCEMFPFAFIGGADISEDQLKIVMDQLPRVNVQNWDICEPWIFGNVDLVTAIEVLMHIEPENIEDAIENLCEVSDSAIITVDWWTEDEDDIRLADLAGFCYLHYYEALFGMNGFSLMKEKKIPFVKQKLRVWRRDE